MKQYRWDAGRSGRPGLAVVQEADGDGDTTASFTHDQGATIMPGVGTILSVRESGASRFLHTDAQGTTRLATSSAQAQVASFDLDAFGVLRSQAGSFSTPYLFTQKERDAGLDLDYFLARQYRPTTGMFVSRDPVGHGLRPYDYARSAPLVRWDPTGLFTLPTDILLLLKCSMQQQSGQPLDPGCFGLCSTYSTLPWCNTVLPPTVGPPTPPPTGWPPPPPPTDGGGGGGGWPPTGDPGGPGWPPTTGGGGGGGGGNNGGGSDHGGGGHDGGGGNNGGGGGHDWHQRERAARCWSIALRTMFGASDPLGEGAAWIKSLVDRCWDRCQGIRDPDKFMECVAEQIVAIAPRRVGRAAAKLACLFMSCMVASDAVWDPTPDLSCEPLPVGGHQRDCEFCTYMRYVNCLCRVPLSNWNWIEWIPVGGSYAWRLVAAYETAKCEAGLAKDLMACDCG